MGRAGFGSRLGETRAFLRAAGKSPSYSFCEAVAFSWAHDVPLAGDGFSVPEADSATGMSLTQIAASARGTPRTRHFDAGGSCRTSRPSWRPLQFTLTPQTPARCAPSVPLPKQHGVRRASCGPLHAQHRARRPSCRSLRAQPLVRRLLAGLCRRTTVSEGAIPRFCGGQTGVGPKLGAIRGTTPAWTAALPPTLPPQYRPCHPAPPRPSLRFPANP